MPKLWRYNLNAEELSENHIYRCSEKHFFLIYPWGIIKYIWKKRSKYNPLWGKLYLKNSHTSIIGIFERIFLRFKIMFHSFSANCLFPKIGSSNSTQDKVPAEDGRMKLSSYSFLFYLWFNCFMMCYTVENWYIRMSFQSAIRATDVQTKLVANFCFKWISVQNNCWKSHLSKIEWKLFRR